MTILLSFEAQHEVQHEHGVLSDLQWSQARLVLAPHWQEHSRVHTAQEGHLELITCQTNVHRTSNEARVRGTDSCGAQEEEKKNWSSKRAELSKAQSVEERRSSDYLSVQTNVEHGEGERKEQRKPRLNEFTSQARARGALAQDISRRSEEIKVSREACGEKERSRNNERCDYARGLRVIGLGLRSTCCMSASGAFLSYGHCLSFSGRARSVQCPPPPLAHRRCAFLTTRRS